ncbi:TolC family protein [Acidovorax sp. SUPP3334]|uniref:TolC family protein n=1 Tax=Acidovorax sp. SUPP3334 TaxID=2920881 RepID=UPI0023DE304A|nr:TolC family protein [Acidovorax sp. SUPP3334]GKT22319.1 TolC family protein [Acidovorax sp. SUPP3334]
MHRHFVSLAVMALAAFPVFSHSQTAPFPFTSTASARAVEAAEPLTLASAISLAWQNNPDLSAAARARDAADGAIRQAGVRPNPVLETTVEDLRQERRTTTVQISQPIELGGKRTARIAAAERARDQAAAAVLARRADIRAAVITAFFEVLAAQERVRLAQDSVGLAQRALHAAGNRVIAGKVSPLEETKAKVAESSAQVERLQAEGALRMAKQQLAALWGNSKPVFTQVEGQIDMLPTPPSPLQIEQRLFNAPALVQARLEIDRRSALTALEQAKRVPDIAVTLGSKRSPDVGGNQWIVGVSIPLPIFDNNQGNLSEALSKEDQARDELLSAELRTASEVNGALETMHSSRLEAETLQRDALPGAESAYQAATKGFELGKFSFLEALDAQRTLLQVRTQTLRALAATHRAASELDRLLGHAGDDVPPTVSSAR